MRSALVLAVCLLAAPIHAQVPEAVDPAQIPAYRAIAPGIVAAGQPAAGKVPEAAARGVPGRPGPWGRGGGRGGREGAPPPPPRSDPVSLRVVQPRWGRVGGGAG